MAGSHELTRMNRDENRVTNLFGRLWACFHWDSSIEAGWVRCVFVTFGHEVKYVSGCDCGLAGPVPGHADGSGGGGGCGGVCPESVGFLAGFAAGGDFGAADSAGFGELFAAVGEIDGRCG